MQGNNHFLQVLSWIASIAGFCLAFFVWLDSGGNAQSVPPSAWPAAPVPPPQVPTPRISYPDISPPSRERPHPSFNCAAATYNSEYLICSSVELSLLDQSLATAYQEAMSRNPGKKSALRKAQNFWLRKIRDRCPDVECLKLTYRNRIAELNNR